MNNFEINVILCRLNSSTFAYRFRYQHIENDLLTALFHALDVIYCERISPPLLLPGGYYFNDDISSKMTPLAHERMLQFYADSVY